ncbi:hypothetical protein D6833_03275 [Candidatus Parcubacteria bacterium]|nr:MAG: hypothetical protein D6833_03275 [Candidatus Parcubacteria bacterium]
MNERIRVLYIMGTARSGSTILEILLAHGKGCVGAGELTAIVQDGFLEDKPCSCGAPFSRCRFWGEVVGKLALTRKELLEWAQLQRRVEWHTGFLRQWLGLLSRSDWQRYCHYNLRLLQALQEVSGAGVIVDSSKYAGRALALAGMPEVDLAVVCLTRSPEGLMASFQKPNREEQHPKNPWQVFRYYAFVMFSLRIVLKRLKERAMTLSYEEFLAEPEAALAAIGQRFGIAMDDVARKIRHHESFDVGHLITGNRLRKKGRVRVSTGMEDRVQGVGRMQIILMKIFCRALGMAGGKHERHHPKLPERGKGA